MQNLKHLVLLCLSLVLACTAFASEVVVNGSAQIVNGNIGGAKNQALQNALRQAVEQGIGALIDSKTIAQNFQIIKDEILSTSKGYVTRYDVLEEGKSQDGTSYDVKIKAEVSEKGLEDKLATLKLLHKKMGNKRVMVIYTTTDKDALGRKNGAVQTTLAAVRDEFNQAGFRVFNEDIMEKVYQTIERSAVVDRPAEQLIALALDQRAEVMVHFEMIAGKRGERGGQFFATKTTVRLGVYDASTGQQIADALGNGKELSAQVPGNYDWYEMLGKAGQRAGRDAAKDAINKIMSYYSNVGDVGNAYLLIFRNYTANEKDAVLDYLENTPGFKSVSELKNSPNYLELELFSSEEKSRLRRKIRADLKEKNILLESQESAGNRIVFFKPGTENQ